MATQANMYIDTFKTTEALSKLVHVYKWLYVQPIVIDPFRSRYYTV